MRDYEALNNILQHMGCCMVEGLSEKALLAKAEEILATARAATDDTLRIKKELDAKRAQIRRNIILLGAKQFYSPRQS